VHGLAPRIPHSARMAADQESRTLNNGMKTSQIGCSLLVALLLATLPMYSQRGGQPGAFDFYLLNLSWSPEFCNSNPNNIECGGGKHFGFIVHGLWPQFSHGGGPEYCGQQPGLIDPTRMLDIMPDPHLIEHEWIAHGTCSGLNANDYFNLIRKTFSSIQIATQFQAPQQQFNIRPFELKQAFEQANPGLSDAGIAISCSGPYLKAVEFCFTKDGRAMACSGVRDCHAGSLRVPKVR
jgi:ribonuclease T2